MKSTSGLKVGSKLEWHYNDFGNPSLIMEVTRVTPGKIVVSYNDEDDGGPCTSHIVKIRTIKDSYNFKILKVFPPSSGSGLRTEIPVDTDRIFCHPNNNRHSIPDELFDYIGELSGSKIETLDILYSYPV